MDIDKFTKSRATPYHERHIKMSMSRNPDGVLIVEDRIESNGFRVAGYLNVPKRDNGKKYCDCGNSIKNLKKATS